MDVPLSTYGLKPVIWIAILSCFCLACEKVIPFKGNTKVSKLVVNAQLRPSQPFQVYVGQSQSPTQADSLSPISNAEVQLIDLATGQESILTELSTGKYGAENHLPEVGQAYEIQINATGFEAVWARDTLPAAPIFEILDTLSTLLDDIPVMRIKLAVKTPGPQQYFILECGYWLIHSSGDSSYFSVLSSEFDPALDNEGLGNDQGAFPYLFLPVIQPDSQQVVVEFLTEQAEAFLDVAETDQVKLVIRLSAASHAWYQYVRSQVKYSLFGFNTFTPQTGQVFSNIQGGLGIFGASNSEEWVIAR